MQYRMSSLEVDPQFSLLLPTHHFHALAVFFLHNVERDTIDVWSFLDDVFDTWLESFGSSCQRLEVLYLANNVKI
jgi:hypothetical protein